MKILAVLLPTVLSLGIAAASIATPSSSDTAVLALRAGLSAEALAASGITSTGVAGIIDDLTESDPAVNGDLAGADATYSSAKSSHDELQRLVKSGQATDQQVADLQQAKIDLDAAIAARDAVLDALFTAATADLTTAQKATLSTIRGNAHWKQPTEFLVIDRTDDEWVELRDLLQHEKTCADLGWEPEAACVTRLAQLRAHTDVATAKTGLDTNLASVRTAWEAAVADE